MSGQRRINWRTPLLALLAAGTLVWSAITQFDIPVSEMVDMLVMSLVFLGVLVSGALVLTLMWKLPRWLLMRNEDNEVEDTISREESISD